MVNEHELFSVDPHSLKIILYYDDLEITNEKTRRKHKLAMFYYQLANIYPAYRSKLKSIHLIAIVETKYLKKYVVDMILKPFIHELNVLGEDHGYNFRINGGNICLRGALLAVLADTPASQFLGAFKESVGGAKRKCRHCTADFESMQTLFTEEDFAPRSKEIREYQLEQLHNNPELYNHYSKEYGVVKRSILMDAPYFNVTKQLPQDIMHVILEGALSRALFFVINWFIDSSVFTELNDFVQNFPYGYTELKDKLVVISNEDLANPSNNLGQTAAQSWLLSRVVAFLVSHLPMSFQMFGRSYKLCWKLLQFAVQRAFLKCYLKGLVKEHLQAFKNCFDENITPKQHYLVHLPSQIFMFGSTVRAWAMRFEAKHQQFKHIL